MSPSLDHTIKTTEYAASDTCPFASQKWGAISTVRHDALCGAINAGKDNRVLAISDAITALNGIMDFALAMRHCVERPAMGMGGGENPEGAVCHRHLRERCKT